MHAEKEKLCIKINGINEIKSKAREIGRNTLTSEENLQAYISNASKTNPKALEELLTERKSRLDRESVIRDEFVSHDRDEKWKKSEEIGSRFCKEREKLPRNVRNFIEMKQVNLDMLKLATTKNKEVIAAAIIGSSLWFNIANTRIVDDNELDIDKIAEKYNEIKERNQLKQQTQQQIQANSVLQGVMLGDNLYMQEMLEEESQGMRM